MSKTGCFGVREDFFFYPPLANALKLAGSEGRWLERGVKYPDHLFPNQCNQLALWGTIPRLLPPPPSFDPGGAGEQTRSGLGLLFLAPGHSVPTTGSKPVIFLDMHPPFPHRHGNHPHRILAWPDSPSQLPCIWKDPPQERPALRKAALDTNPSCWGPQGPSLR